MLNYKSIDFEYFVKHPMILYIPYLSIIWYIPFYQTTQYNQSISGNVLLASDCGECSVENCRFCTPELSLDCDPTLKICHSLMTRHRVDHKILLVTVYDDNASLLSVTSYPTITTIDTSSLSRLFLVSRQLLRDLSSPPLHGRHVSVSREFVVARCSRQWRLHRFFRRFAGLAFVDALVLLVLKLGLVRESVVV